MDHAALLARFRGRLRRVVAVGGTARLVAVLLGAGGAAVLADRIWFLPGWLRLGLLAAIAIGAGMVAWRRLIRPLRHRLPDRELASFVERRVPELDGRLLSAVDGLDLGSAESAAIERALPAGAELRLLPATALPQAVAVAGVALLAASATALLAPGFWRDGLTRLLMPLAEHDWERTTVFTARLERPVVAADEPATVLVERTAGRPGPAKVSWDDGRGHGGVRQLPGSSGPWRQAIALSPGAWTIGVSGGDAHPVHLPVLVVERPHLDGAAARLTPPAYSGLPAQDLPTPACQVLPGSRLDLALRLATPAGRTLGAVSARLGGQAIALTGDGATWTGSCTVRTAAELTIDASDVDGIALRPSARFPIAVEPDRVPSVSLSGPRSDETVGPHAKVTVAIEASDDIGIGSVALTATGAASGTAAGEPRTLHQEDVDGRRSVNRKLLVDVAGLAGAGGTITLTGRAADRNDVGGPGIGTSAPLVLRVVPEDELRRDLERQLTEARDRIAQARSQLSPGLADAAKLPAGARTAAQDAARATELLARTLRRWNENALEPDRIAPAGEARAASEAAAAPLAKATGGDQDAARAADAQLDKAERALERMLSDSDLTRIIAQLLERQKALLAESRAFVREHLVRQPDEAGRARQSDLATRQGDLARRCAEAERKVLSGPAALDTAKEAVRHGAPAEAMGGAAADLASGDQRPRALERQTSAIAALEALLKALRGGDQQADLARRVGELADRQERLAEAIERGMDQAEARREQARLRQEAERLAAEVDQPAEADRAMDAAVGAQQGAEQALGANDRAAGARDAGTAADLLRRAQQGLDPKSDPEKQDKDKTKSQTDVLALLRSLFDQQARVLSDSLPVHKRIGEDDLDFAATRDVATVAQLQDDVLLRLREEGIKMLDRQPIAQSALKRVETAMARTLEHLRRPALGSRGLTLERIALHELKRLINVAANLPQYRKQGQDGQGGQGDQPPFPPAAEIGLLIAEQDDILAAVAAGRPAPLAERQAELVKLLTMVEGAVNPASRPGVLVQRARRSAADAGLRLGRSERGTTTRDQMLVAGEALRQLLAEAKGQGGASQPKPQPKPSSKPKPGDDGQASKPPSGGSSPGSPSPASASAAKPGETARSAAGVSADQERTVLLQLPPERREQLRQAREERLPAGALQLYERYLEKLEEP